MILHRSFEPASRKRRHASASKVEAGTMRPEDKLVAKLLSRKSCPAPPEMLKKETNEK